MSTTTEDWSDPDPGLRFMQSYMGICFAASCLITGIVHPSAFPFLAILSVAGFLYAYTRSWFAFLVPPVLLPLVEIILHLLSELGVIA